MSHCNISQFICRYFLHPMIGRWTVRKEFGPAPARKYKPNLKCAHDCMITNPHTQVTNESDYSLKKNSKLIDIAALWKRSGPNVCPNGFPPPEHTRASLSASRRVDSEP